MAAAMAEKQLRKSGGTFFSIGEIVIRLRPELFFSAALFNDLRRQGFARHLKKRLQQYRLERAELTANDFPWPAGEVSFLDNIGNRKAEAFYRRHGVVKIDRKTLRAADVAGCSLMTSRYCIRAQLDICPKISNTTDGSAGPLTLVDNTGEYELRFDCRKCHMIVLKPAPINVK
jgi:putative protease